MFQSRAGTLSRGRRCGGLGETAPIDQRVIRIGYIGYDQDLPAQDLFAQTGALTV